MKKTKGFMTLAASIITLLMLMILPSCDGNFSDPGTEEYLNGNGTGGIVGWGGGGGYGSGGGGDYFGGGKFTLTDIPAEYNRYYAMLSVYIDDGNPYEVIAGQDPTGQNNGFVRFSSSAQFTMRKTSISPLGPFGGGGIAGTGINVAGYYGNDTYDVLINIYQRFPSYTVNTLPAVGELGFIIFYDVKFSNGNATKSWKDADLSMLD